MAASTCASRCRVRDCSVARRRCEIMWTHEFRRSGSNRLHSQRVPWYRELTRYHWFVLVVCLAWLAVRHDGPAALQPGAAAGDQRTAGRARDRPGDGRRLCRLRHHDLHDRLGVGRRLLRHSRRPHRAGEDDDADHPLLLALHRPERAVEERLGLLGLPLPDRARRGRTVRGRRGAGGRDDAGSRAALRSRVAAGALGGREHDWRR